MWFAWSLCPVSPPCCAGLGSGLAAVVIGAQGSQVAEAVVVAGLHVVHVGGVFGAALSVLNRSALVSITFECLRAERCPVVG